jgi:hypothetical protein
MKKYFLSLSSLKTVKRKKSIGQCDGHFISSVFLVNNLVLSFKQLRSKNQTALFEVYERHARGKKGFFILT